MDDGGMIANAYLPAEHPANHIPQRTADISQFTAEVTQLADFLVRWGNTVKYL